MSNVPLRVHDEFGQPWDIDSNDALWPEADTATKHGAQDATFPLAIITAKRGWGWWSCFKRQDEWLANIGVPVPDHTLMESAANASAADLTPLLQRFGAYVAFLEVQTGLLIARRNALKSAYEAALAVASAGIDEKMSEKAKESQVLASHETIRQARRMYIETDLLMETAKGMCSGYQHAYDAVSRIVSVRLAEMELQPRRAP